MILTVNFCEYVWPFVATKHHRVRTFLPSMQVNIRDAKRLKNQNPKKFE